MLCYARAGRGVEICIYCQSRNRFNSAQPSGRIGLVIVVCGMLGSMVSGIILDKWVEDNGGDGDHDDKKIVYLL